MQDSTTKAGARLAETGLLTFTLAGREVAELDTTSATLRKRIRGSKHMLRRPPAIVWDVQILRQAEALGAVRCEVRDVETGITYRCTLARLWEKSIEINHGFGRQMALPLRFWQVNDEPPPAEQLSLLSEGER